MLDQLDNGRDCCAPLRPDRDEPPDLIVAKQPRMSIGSRARGPGRSVPAHSAPPRAAPAHPPTGGRPICPEWSLLASSC
jgi:hypothetical protein